MSLISGLTYPTKLAGFFGLSCYLLLRNKIKELIPSSNPNKDTLIFMGHGDQDPVVGTPWGIQSADKLKEWGYNVDFKLYRYVLTTASSGRF